jgi:hypothetical protein
LIDLDQHTQPYGQYVHATMFGNKNSSAGMHQISTRKAEFSRRRIWQILSMISKSGLVLEGNYSELGLNDRFLLLGFLFLLRWPLLNT